MARETGNDATVVSGIGLHSSLGGAVAAAAAFRCGMSRARELPGWPYFDEVENEDHFLVGNLAMGVAIGFQGIARLLKLGTMALADLRGSVDFASLTPSRLGVHLVLAAEQAEQEVDRTPNDLLRRLCKLSGLNVDAANLRTSFDGRLGAVAAIQAAQRSLAEGQFDQVLVGAIDSLLGVERMTDLIENRMIKSVDNPVGLVPGEAASFILLQSVRQAKRRGEGVEVTVPPPVMIAPRETDAAATAGRPRPALGKVMLDVLRAAGVGESSIGTLYVDLNGTTQRALDFGGALVQMSSVFPRDAWRPAFPAASFGETGAASALVATCLAVRGFVREPGKGRCALVVTSCETDGDAAFALRAVD